jgi:cyanophycinase
MGRGTALLGIVLLVAGCSYAAQSRDMPRGHLVLNGGGSKPAPVMEKFIELAGGRDAEIVVFPTASELDDTGEVYVELFVSEHGCTDVRVAGVVDRTDAQDDELAARVRQAGGIWFSGGDQRRITAALIGTPVGEAVIEAFGRGAVVGGTSAGTACQSPLMITGDGDFSVMTADNVELWKGLGLFPGVIVDQHFVARGRHNRLISVVLEHPELLGVGVDEATAVWVRPDGTFEVLGEGWVMVFDAAGAEIRRRPRRDGATSLGVHDMTVHVLLPGEVFDTNERRLALEDPWAAD